MRDNIQVRLVEGNLTEKPILITKKKSLMSVKTGLLRRLQEQTLSDAPL